MAWQHLLDFIGLLACYELAMLLLRSLCYPWQKECSLSSVAGGWVSVPWKCLMLLWKLMFLQIPWTEEPGRLQSMGSRRVGHDWATSLSLFTFLHWRRKWQPTPVFLPGESQGRGEPGGLPFMGSHRVGHDWSDLAAAAAVGEVSFLVCLLHSVAKTDTSTWCILVSKESEWSRFQSPVQEMIHLTLYTYLPKFIWSVTVFGSLSAWCFCYLFAYLVCCFIFCPHSVMLYSDAQWVYCPTSCFCFRPPYQRYLNGDGCSNGWRGRCQQRLLLWEACWISIPICWNQEENENCASQPVNNNQRVWSSNTTHVVGEGVHTAHLAILQQGGSARFQRCIGLQFFHSDIFVDCLHIQ